MSTLFRTKPISIEAYQWTGKNKREVAHFTDGRAVFTPRLARGVRGEVDLTVPAPEGGYRIVAVGCWIIKRGEHFTLCPPREFAETYDPVEENVDGRDERSDGPATIVVVTNETNGRVVDCYAELAGQRVAQLGITDASRSAGLGGGSTGIEVPSFFARWETGDPPEVEHLTAWQSGPPVGVARVPDGSLEHLRAKGDDVQFTEDEARHAAMTKDG